MIRAVLVDLDDTLFDFHQTEALAVGRTMEKIGIEPTKERIRRYSELNQQQWELLEQGKITKEQVLIRRFELFLAEVGSDADAAATRDLYERTLGEYAILLPGAEELVRTLHENYRVYIASNGIGSVQDSRLSKISFADCFDGVFISERMGCNKPSLEFFHKCFERMPDFRPEETIIFGDSLTSDIFGGLQAGIHTCWYNPHGKPGRADIQPEYEVHRLEELPEVLERI